MNYSSLFLKNKSKIKVSYHIIRWWRYSSNIEGI